MSLIFLGIYLRVEFLIHRVILCFSATTKLYSIMTRPFCIPIGNVQGLQFLHLLAKICCFLFVKKNYRHRSECELLSHCSFDLYLLWLIKNCTWNLCLSYMIRHADMNCHEERSLCLQIPRTRSVIQHSGHVGMDQSWSVGRVGRGNGWEEHDTEPTFSQEGKTEESKQSSTGWYQ